MRTTSVSVGPRLLALLFASILSSGSGCPTQVNLLQSMELAPGQTPVLNTLLRYHLNGSGTCQGDISVDWGDGASEVTGYCHSTTDANGRKRFQCVVFHFHMGWGGGRTMTATALSGCEGKVRLRLNFPPPNRRIALVRPGPNVCDPVPGAGGATVAARTLVKITTAPTNTPCGGIYYRDPTPHCYDAEGGVATFPPPPSGTPPPVFPFPTMRDFSLVVRVGTQVVQGGTNMSFVTDQRGPLELCVNEPDSTAGVGGYEVTIETDQLGPP